MMPAGNDDADDRPGLLPRREWVGPSARVARRLGQRQGDRIVKCRAKLMRLAALGHELRRPEADLLRDGIYELRIGLSHINYRLLDCFSGKDTVVVSHGFTKEATVPASEIVLAIARRERFRLDLTTHSFRE
jgi:phage-related protein